ncbi:hypothetical protein DUI87_19578 [Hirundo rustica rustica]|uniref:Integrase catalytic domain-containing protein n=1 Tax=Hirundo rustica rustica TaxID=333673 RepID=A0A3M0JSV0_HIRRU|nr:hypothetical protein DUI87_19578 [Hirundo rustica rustica]
MERQGSRQPALPRGTPASTPVLAGGARREISGSTGHAAWENPPSPLLIGSRLQLTEGLHLKDDNWNFVTVDNSEQGTWPRVKGFELQEDKVQRMPPWRYLGLEIGKRTIVPQKLEIKAKIQTLADVHQLCGALNWLRPWLGLTTEDLAPLFNLLKGGEELSSPRELTPEGSEGGAGKGEKTLDAIKHLIQAFSFMGIPKELKTDNGPAYRSKEFCSFLQQWGVGHKTGIPHSPTGQAVVERTHREIKRVLNQQQPVLKTETPQTRLARALFTLNFLNSTFEFLNPPIVRHFGANPQLNIKERPPVMVRTLRLEGQRDLMI